MHEMVLAITHEKTVYLPLVSDCVKISWELAGMPGKMTFDLYNDKNINFQEGDKVQFAFDGVTVFCGYVFIKKRDRRQIIGVTAYDQLRYLKNKDTSHYYDMTATQAITEIAKGCGLQIGEFEDTKVPIAYRGKDTTYFDMIQEVLGQTLQAAKIKYVLYDDVGKLMLKATDNMRVNSYLCSEVIENFSYETSIDGDTYNQIVLYHTDEEKQRQFFTAEDRSTIGKWGLLRYYESAENAETAQQKAEGLLALYNRKGRKLSVSGMLGDIQVRAGSMLPVSLILGDVNAEQDFLRVDSVSHTFKTGIHTMDLELWGGLFV